MSILHSHCPEPKPRSRSELSPSDYLYSMSAVSPQAPPAIITVRADLTGALSITTEIFKLRMTLLRRDTQPQEPVVSGRRPRVLQLLQGYKKGSIDKYILLGQAFIEIQGEKDELLQHQLEQDVREALNVGDDHLMEGNNSIRVGRRIVLANYIRYADPTLEKELTKSGPTLSTLSELLHSHVCEDSYILQLFFFRLVNQCDRKKSAVKELVEQVTGDGHGEMLRVRDGGLQLQLHH